MKTDFESFTRWLLRELTEDEKARLADAARAHIYGVQGLSDEPLEPTWLETSLEAFLEMLEK
jgi:hypothetical protein